MLRAQGPGAGGRRRLLVSVSPRLGRERERRVPGAGRARSESYSAARWSGPHGCYGNYNKQNSIENEERARNDAEDLKSQLLRG
ncbi:hypothetical protein H671_1g1389 [Cricetulus griseus]|nr:hypothetical protein H671_1g1389 [Cricetulus griseus]